MYSSFLIFLIFYLLSSYASCPFFYFSKLFVCFTFVTYYPYKGVPEWAWMWNHSSSGSLSSVASLGRTEPHKPFHQPWLSGYSLRLVQSFSANQISSIHKCQGHVRLIRKCFMVLLSDSRIHLVPFPGKSLELDQGDMVSHLSLNPHFFTCLLHVDKWGDSVVTIFHC